MRDGRTEKSPRAMADLEAAEAFSEWNATLVVVEGGALGSEHPVDRRRLVLGRGPEVDLAFEDSEMSQQHAVVEFESGAFRVIDLDSTNGTCVNGERIKERPISHGDRIACGTVVFQVLLEKRDRAPRTYLLRDD